IVDATALTAMRTGALTALGARELARRGSRVLGHVGSRGTAYWNVRLLDRLFDFEEIRVHSRRRESRDAFARRLEEDLGKPIRGAARARRDGPTQRADPPRRALPDRGRRQARTRVGRGTDPVLASRPEPERHRARPRAAREGAPRRRRADARALGVLGELVRVRDRDAAHDPVHVVLVVAHAPEGGAVDVDRRRRLAARVPDA